MLEYNIVGVIVATISIVGFLLLYRKTEEIAFLFAGTVIYLKLLFSTFGLLNEYIFIVPECLITVWLAILLFKSRLKIIVPIIIVLCLFYTICIMYDFFSQFGLPGIVIMLICAYMVHQKEKNGEIKVK